MESIIVFIAEFNVYVWFEFKVKLVMLFRLTYMLPRLIKDRSLAIAGSNKSDRRIKDFIHSTKSNREERIVACSYLSKGYEVLHYLEVLNADVDEVCRLQSIYSDKIFEELKII